MLPEPTPEESAVRTLLTLLAVLVLVVIGIPALLLATGTIDTTSINMALNVMVGKSGPPADRDTVIRAARRFMLSALVGNPEVPEKV